MHLFVLDLVISLDMLSPIISTITKKKQKVLIFNSNPSHRHYGNQNKILNFLLKSNNSKLLNNNLTMNLVIYIFRILIYLQILLTNKKMYKFWKKIWNSTFYLSEKYMLNELRRNDVKSITILEDLPINKKFFFKTLASKLNIPLIMINGGINTIPSKKKFNVFEPDYFLASNINKNHSIVKKSKTYKVFGCLRYSNKWINKLDKIFGFDQKNKKFSIGIFNNPTSEFSNEVEKLINFLKDKKFNVIVNSKPREIIPYNLTYQSKEISASEIINKSDVIISYSTSILLEAIERKKLILFPNYLKKFYKNNKHSIFQKNKFILYPRSEKQLLAVLSKIKKKKKKEIIYKMNIRNNLYKIIFINNFKAEKNFNNFYRSL